MKTILMSHLFLICLVFSLLCVPNSVAQEEQESIDEMKKKAPKVYVDCPRCDIDYIRTEITFVNYVWDRREADVHILVTTQRTGAAGTEYTIAFIGQNDYKDFQNTLKYVAYQTDTEDDTRRGLVRILKMGLVSIAARTPISEKIDVSFKEEVKSTAVEDKWNFWVFSIGAQGFFSGQKTLKNIDIYGNLSANRVTPESKLRLGLSFNFDESNFDFDSTSISSSSESQSFSGLFVKSVSEHWSLGVYLKINRSTYRNLDLSIQPAPAVEYNMFPYSQSTRRQLRFLYTVGYTYADYQEETIYEKMSENLFGESLSITLDLKERWGTIETSVEWSHYFHDFSKNRLSISGEVSIRLFKGLSLDVFGSYSQIHDQLSLQKGGATLEEVLLRRRELETNYSYFGLVGLSYSFGSIYSNVVNPRFGN